MIKGFPNNLILVFLYLGLDNKYSNGDFLYFTILKLKLFNKVLIRCLITYDSYKIIIQNYFENILLLYSLYI